MDWPYCAPNLPRHVATGHVLRGVGLTNGGSRHLRTCASAIGAVRSAQIPLQVPAVRADCAVAALPSWGCCAGVGTNLGLPLRSAPASAILEWSTLALVCNPQWSRLKAQTFRQGTKTPIHKLSIDI